MIGRRLLAAAGAVLLTGCGAVSVPPTPPSLSLAPPTPAGMA